MALPAILTGTPNANIGGPAPSVAPGSSANPAPAPTGFHAPMASKGTFWQGADGNVYVNGSQGVHSAGKFDNNTVKYWNNLGYGQQDDPNAPAKNPFNPNKNVTGAATVYPDKSNDISMQQTGLDNVQGGVDASLGKLSDTYNNVMGQYNGDLADANKSYTNNSNDNRNDLESNKGTALQNARQGRQGLFGTLASLGALNGSGIELANEAVRRGANEDLKTASNNFATNQNTLDTGYNTYTKQEKKLQDQATHAYGNDQQQVKNDAAKQRQQFLINIANDYQSEGNAARAKTFMDQASSLFPEISQTSVPTMDIGYSGGSYAAPTLNQYVGKANNTTVQSTPGGTGSLSLFNIPGLIADNKKVAA